MASIIQMRRDTAANWTSNNPTLANGEIGFETDTYSMKIGDGTTVWASLAYFTGGAGTGDVVGPAGATDTALALFDTGTGKLLKNSIALLSAAGAMTGLTSILVNNDGATAGNISLVEPSGGSNIKLQAPALAANVTLTLPVDDGDANQVLQTDGTGVLSWVDQGSGGVSGLGSYRFKTGGSTTPASGEVTHNGASDDFSAATTMYFHDTNREGVDLNTIWTNLIDTDSRLYLQDPADSTIGYLYRVTATPSETASVFTVSVAFEAESTGGDAANNTDLGLLVVGGAGGGSGDVTAAANITDNALVRGDGGAKGIQESGILVSDTDDLTGVTSVTIDSTAGITFDTSLDQDHDLLTVAVTGGGTTVKLWWDESEDRFVFNKDVEVPTEIYGPGWNGKNEVPTKDAVYDKIATVDNELALKLEDGDLVTRLDTGSGHRTLYSDAAGNLQELAFGATAGHVLTSNGASTPPSWQAAPGGGATELSDLTDVNTSTPTNRNVLVADGVDWESRALVEADISNLQSYLTAEVNDLTAAVTWANVPDANITQSSVTQHVGAIDHDSLLNFDAAEHFTKASINIGDLGDVNSTTPAVRHVLVYDGVDSYDNRLLTEADISDLQAYLTAEVNDLTAAVVWTNVPDANITQSSVTQHQGAIDHDSLLNFDANEHFTKASINIGDLGDVNSTTPAARHVLVYDGVDSYDNRLLVEADISDLQSYLTAEVNDLTAAVVWTNVPDANITQSSVTQHVAAIDHDQLLNFDANEHFTKASINIGDLGDVNSTTPANRHVLAYDGVDSYDNRLLVEADISDLGTYLENVSEDATPTLGGQLDGNSNSIIGVTNLTLTSLTSGLILDPVIDQDIDIFSVDVTGAPRVYWDESGDHIHSTKGWFFTEKISTLGDPTVGDDIGNRDYNDARYLQNVSGEDHGTLAGLTDDDHTQYVLLAGRSGGQLVYGGTGATDELELRGSTNAAKGFIKTSSRILVEHSETTGTGLAAISYSILQDDTFTVNAVENTGFISYVPTIDWDINIGFVRCVNAAPTITSDTNPALSGFLLFDGAPVLKTEGTNSPLPPVIFNAIPTMQQTAAATATVAIADGLRFNPTTKADIASSVLTVTEQNAVTFTPGANAVNATSTANLGTLRGLWCKTTTHTGSGTTTITDHIGLDFQNDTKAVTGERAVVRSALNSHANNWFLKNDGTAKIDLGTANFGINGATPVAKQTVTGSRGGNAALASLLTAMANYGWITDSTTA